MADDTTSGTTSTDLPRAGAADPAVPRPGAASVPPGADPAPLVEQPSLKPAGLGAEGPGTADETLAAMDDSPAGESEAPPHRSAADTIREEAARLGDQARERARSFAGEGKDRATGALEELSRMFETAAGEVDSRLGENYGQYARSAAQGIAGFADNLRGKEVDDLLDDVSAFVRKSPAVAIGTAAALGFVVARLIRSGLDAASEAGDAPEAPEQG